jgi:hypothetical protein
MAPAVVAHPGTWPTAKGEPLWTHKVYAPQPLKFSRGIHCYGSGWIYEATEDASHECWMCLGTGPKMDRVQRIIFRADLDAHHSCLERPGR